MISELAANERRRTPTRTTAPIHHAAGAATSAFTMRKKHSAAYGYAIVSSTMYEEYASDGIAPRAGGGEERRACGRRASRARK